MPATHIYHMLSVLLFAFLDPPVSHLGADSSLYQYPVGLLLLNECENKMEKLIPKSYLHPQMWGVRLLKKKNNNLKQFNGYLSVGTFIS